MKTEQYVLLKQSGDICIKPFGEYNDYEVVVEELSEELNEKIEELTDRVEVEEKKRKSFRVQTILFVLVGIGIAAYGWETGIWTI